MYRRIIKYCGGEIKRFFYDIFSPPLMGRITARNGPKMKRCGAPEHRGVGEGDVHLALINRRP